MGENSSWVTESGLLEDFDFEVEEAWFGEDEEADQPDDRVFLFLRGTAVDDEGEEHDEHRERYSVGKNWEVVEEGAEIESANGRNRFNQNTGIGRLINALVAISDEAAEFLQSRGEAYQAVTFDGLKLHMERKLVSKFETDDGEEVEWYLNLPTDITIDKKKGAKKGGSKGGKGKASRSASKTAKSKGNAKLRAAISEFAGEFEDDEHDEFVDQVLDEDVFERAQEIMDDDELHADVLDPDSDLWTPKGS